MGINLIETSHLKSIKIDFKKANENPSNEPSIQEGLFYYSNLLASNFSVLFTKSRIPLATVFFVSCKQFYHYLVIQKYAYRLPL